MAEPPPLTLGTAGHIDHGKTALVGALTGVATDRLPEERRRGISIALGYAELRLGSGRRLSVIDVPGHERFVRTMVAGATGIDLFLMTIAADDGVMPQTREHATILRALAVSPGVVAITKSDRADPAPAAAAARELFPGAPIVAVSAQTGGGLDALRRALEHVASGIPGRAGMPGPARLHVDRAFSVTGVGTVVTGTLWAGRLARGAEVTILPARRRARIRRLEVHGAQREAAAAGRRVAVALAGIDRDEVGPGDVITAPASELAASFRLDLALDAGVGLADGGRVLVHHGTRESRARAVRLGDDAWQLRLDAPVIACRGDRVVLRRIAPPGTLGGARVLDPAPPRRSRGHGLASARPVERAPAPAPRAPSPSPAAAHAARAGELDARLRAGGLGSLDEVRRALVAELAVNGSVTVAALRDRLGTSRRLALELLTHLDDERVTVRRADDRRVLRGRSSRSRPDVD